MIKNLFAFFIFCCFSIIVYSQEKIEITNIIITGNKITKDDVLLRELTFKKGDVLSQASLEGKIKESKENLTNLMLFNFNHITFENNTEKTDVYIEVVERWYIWPYPILEISERNFNVWWDEFKESSY